jgi:hypothetical protein
MNSRPNPDAVLAARADERLAHAYQQIARADDDLARVTEKLSKMQRDAAGPPASAGGPRPSRDRPALRGLVGLVLTAGICAAAYAAQWSPYGEAARLTIAQWAPSLIPTSSPRLAKVGDGAAPVSPALQLAAAEPAAPQPASPVQDVAPTPAPMPPELTQMLQSMARDIATVEQGIEQLKVRQEQMATDNARAIEQLKASQGQVAHLAAKPAAPDPRAKAAAPPPPHVASAAHKPPPAPPPQARAHPKPIQLQPDQQ